MIWAVRIYESWASTATGEIVAEFFAPVGLEMEKGNAQSANPSQPIKRS